MNASETVTAFIHAIERRDLDAALAFVTDDCEYDNVPMAKVFGPEAIRTVLGPFAAGCSAIEWVVTHQVAHDDGEGGGVVMNERVDRFEMGGRWIELPVAGLFVLRGGRIALWRDYFDNQMFRSALAGPSA